MRHNNLKKLLAAALCVAGVACNPLGDLGGFGGFGAFGPTTSAPYVFQVWPDGQRILIGDTVTFTSTTCPEPCTVGTSVASDWSLNGVSLAPKSTINAAAALLTRAENVGTAYVTATARTDASKTRTVSMTVLDSADVDEVRLTPWSAMKNSTGVYEFKGAQQDISAELRASGWQVFRGVPTSWSVSDTSIVRLTAHGNPYLPNSRTIWVKKAGTVDIVARFLAVETTVRFSVTP